MINLEETPIQKEIRALARRFAQTELIPIVEEDEKTETFRPEIIQKLGQLGLTGIPLSENYGGSGLGYLEYCIALEEIATISTSYAISVAVTGLTQIILSLFGNETQKIKYIPSLAQGKAIGAFSLSEAGSGSDAASLQTKAIKKNNGYLIQGTKLWTTQGDIADTIILLARTGEKGPKGISAFIIEKGMKGLHYGKREKKMGCHISHTMELIFDEVFVPEDHLIGKPGDGFKIAMTALNSGRITIAASALGIAKQSLEIATDHSLQRKQFEKTISEFQGVSFMLADMSVLLESSRLLIQKAAWLKDQGKEFSQEAAMAKLFTTDAAMKITTDAIQILGGSGYTQDFPLERYMREAKVLQIVEGTNQIQRHVIAKNLLSKHSNQTFKK